MGRFTPNWLDRVTARKKPIFFESSQPTKLPAISTFTGHWNIPLRLVIWPSQCTLHTVIPSLPPPDLRRQQGAYHDQRNGISSRAGNDCRNPSVARGDSEDYSGLALETLAHSARSRAVSVRKQRRFVVGLCISWNRRRTTAHVPKQGAGSDTARPFADRRITI
jgi:hypothetical protein